MRIRCLDSTIDDGSGDDVVSINASANSNNGWGWGNAATATGIGSTEINLGSGDDAEYQCLSSWQRQ